ncbi:PTS IIA-like nitrogen regulatory protein PtsN [Fodinicurvata sp. EGI_FJ10296]|uniref:PTS IIA-like nitrogen regulatory protein PtsN n=1 Tax=Fodinicurvata sp. EGI_FJ10296 TaxID=3231908 RepID=UPI003453C293
MVDFVTPASIIPVLRGTSKKQVLQELARHAATVTGLRERAIFDVLLDREKLGTTGVGRGVAIPHGKLPQLTSVHGFVAKLEKPIDFDAVDDAPVDLIFMLLAPEKAGADHLKALAKVSRLLRDPALCQKLRGCETSDAIFAVIASQLDASAA